MEGAGELFQWEGPLIKGSLLLKENTGSTFAKKITVSNKSIAVLNAIF